MENKYLVKVAQMLDLEKEAAFSDAAKAAIKSLAPRFKNMGVGSSSNARAIAKNVIGKDGGKFEGVFTAGEKGKARTLIDAIAKKHGLERDEAGQVLSTAAGLGRRMAKTESF